MKKKYGPLPLWAWGAVGIVAVYLWYRYSQSSSSSTSSTTASTDGIDPVTGVPLADEETAYQNEAASALSPGSGGGDGSTGTSTGPDLGQELSDVTGFITDLEDAGLVAAPGSNSNGASAAPTNQSVPTTTPQTNNRISTGHLLTKKAIQAPFGSSAPPPKNGYTVIGTGGGNHQYVPDNLVTAAGGYLYNKISSTAPKVRSNQIAKGLGGGLWEVIPKPKNTRRGRR